MYDAYCLLRHRTYMHWMYRMHETWYSEKDEIVPVHGRKAHVRVELYHNAFLTSALDEMSGQLKALAALPPGKELSEPTEYEAG